MMVGISSWNSLPGNHV